MAESVYPDDSSAEPFTGRRRRLLLAAGAITLTVGLAPRLLSARPQQYPPADHREPGHGVPGNGVPGRPGVPGLQHHHSPSYPSYPMDRPLYYIRDSSRSIALTIDDGPDPVYTPQVLKVLRQYNVTATFSMIGVHVAAYPQLARAVTEAGHQIANHTWTHANLASRPTHRVASELVRGSQAIHTATGVAPGLFRAPYGAWSPAVIRQCEQMRMVPLDWSVDPRDWARPGARSIIRTILSNTRPGSIILEHDGGGDRSQTVAALRVFLPRLQHEGYHFVTP